MSSLIIFVINNILLYVKDKKYDIETSIYNFVLNRLQSNSLIKFDNDKVLSKKHIAAEKAVLPVYSDLFQVCGGGH